VTEAKRAACVIDGSMKNNEHEKKEKHRHYAASLRTAAAHNDIHLRAPLPPASLDSSMKKLGRRSSEERWHK